MPIPFFTDIDIPAPLPIPGNVEYLSNTQRAQLLSGIEINQNVLPQSPSDYIVCSGVYYYQQFTLPSTFSRAETINPDITGVQACVNVAPSVSALTLDTVLLASGITTVVTSGNIVVTSGSIGGWQFLASGTAVGVHATGPQIWADIYFDNNVQITNQLQDATFSVGLRTTNIGGWNFSQPNPYPGGAAYHPDNRTPLNPASSFMFRVLTYSADSGVDWLGNNYRNVVINQSANNISTFGSPDLSTYWLSKPNPSKFGIESLYFDISDAFDRAQTIDRILLDPLTQGPIFHVYYSSDGDPVTTSDQWDNKLWIPVAQTYRITKRDVFAFPFPITARYIKIEFTRLQAQYYNAGTFSQPVIYRKYPMWLYNYFVGAQPPLTSDSFISNTINVVYNKLQLAFDYYLGDLISQPTAPTQFQTSITQALPSTNLAQQVTPQTLTRINTNLAPFTVPVGASTTGNSVLSQFIRSSVNLFNYPVESLGVPVAVNTTTVSVPDRDQIVQQENLPDIYFFINCRHSYQMTQANFEYNRGYFVGLRQLVFLREDYSIPSDQPFYVESAGDNQNVYRNDFLSLNNTWQVGSVD